MFLNVHMSGALKNIPAAGTQPVILKNMMPSWQGRRFSEPVRARLLPLDRCAKINAGLDGRDFVTPEDIHAVIYDILRHRIILTFEAQAEG